MTGFTSSTTGKNFLKVSMYNMYNAYNDIHDTIISRYMRLPVLANQDQQRCYCTTIETMCYGFKLLSIVLWTIFSNDEAVSHRCSQGISRQR